MKISQLWWGLVFGALTSSFVLAEDDHRREFAQRIEALLNLGWQGDAAGLEAAQAQAEKAASLDPLDAHADYALALVQLRARKFSAAQSSLASALAKNPTDLYSWRAQLWLHMYRREYEQAFAQMQQQSDRIATEAAKGTNDPRHAAAARIMGRMYGFLSGPGAERVAAADLLANEEQLLAKQNKAFQEAFAVGRNELLSEFQKRETKLDADRVEADAASAIDRQKDLKFVDEERARIESEAATLETEAATAKSAAESRVSELDSQLSPLQRQLADLENAAQPIQNRLRDLQARYSRALDRSREKQGESKEERDRQRGERDRARRDADRWRAEIRVEEERLRPFINEARRTQAAMQRIAQQKAIEIANANRKLNDLTASARKLQRTDKLLGAQERKLETGKAAAPPHVQGQKAELTALSTYEPFPLDAERQRLLRQFSSTRTTPR